MKNADKESILRLEAIICAHENPWRYTRDFFIARCGEKRSPFSKKREKTRNLHRKLCPCIYLNEKMRRES